MTTRDDEFEAFLDEAFGVVPDDNPEPSSDFPSDEEAAVAVLAGLPAQARVAQAFDLMEANRVGVVRRAVERGVVSARAVDPESRMPLAHMAAGMNAVELLRVLVRKGVSPNWRSPVRGTLHALRYSCLNGAAALMLINEAPGCDLDARGTWEQTPLILAAGSGLLGVVKALVGEGVEVDAVDKLGGTALAYAVAAREEECALYLLQEAGASWGGTVRDERGEKSNMLGIAILSGSPRVVKAVVQRMRAEGVNGKGLV